MNANILKCIYITALLLLILLPTHAAIAQQDQMGLLAYIQGGDLWVKELPDGQARQLTADGRNRSPRWSPSGQWLAYLKDDVLWVVRNSGTDVRVLNDGAPVYGFAWSPVSDTLAYRTRTGSLRAASAGEWRQRELVASVSGKAGSGVWSMAWSPDGEWLAYARVDVLKEAQEGQPPDRSAGLWRIRADGSDAFELLDIGKPAEDGIIVAGWSKDGQHILFWFDPDFSASILADGVPLFAIPASGGEPCQLDQAMLLHADFRASSPDGTLLAITEGGGRETWTHKRIAVVELSSGKLIYLTDEETAAFSPAWSPDGRRIAYAAAPDIGWVGGGDDAKAGAARRRIWVMNSDGSDKRQLANDAAYRDERPLWSADGAHVLFARLDQDDRASLWLMRADGSELEQVVDELSPNLSRAPWWFGYYGHIQWSDYFDWWTGAPRSSLPVTGSTRPVPILSLVMAIVALVAGLWLIVWGCKAHLPGQTKGAP